MHAPFPYRCCCFICRCEPSRAREGEPRSASNIASEPALRANKPDARRPACCHPTWADCIKQQEFKLCGRLDSFKNRAWGKGPHTASHRKITHRVSNFSGHSVTSFPTLRCVSREGRGQSLSGRLGTMCRANWAARAHLFQ